MESAMVAEQMYYIIDGSGNYYRLNDEKQLIVSRGKDNADLFELNEANQRLSNGRKKSFYSIVPADIENTVKVAEPIVFQSRMPETAKKEDIIYEYDLDKLDWKEYLLHFNYIVASVKRYQDQLDKQLSEADMCICDLMHYLELYDLGDAEFQMAAEMIKEYREKRRAIKDKQYITEYFQKGLGTNENLSKGKEILGLINKLSHRTYKPRVLTDMFTDTLIPTEKKLNAEAQIVEIQEWAEVPMKQNTHERKETRFDNQENDWQEFAAKQASFFEDAGQYACNLQITLEELDVEIEEILLQTETANCNVTQGYKVFKMLKELRNERKKVVRELECVQTIIQCFDCEAMGNAYRYCEERMREVETDKE